MYLIRWNARAYAASISGVKRVPVYNCGRNEKRNDPLLPRIKDEFALKPKQAMFSPINDTREGGGVILIFHCNSS